MKDTMIDLDALQGFTPGPWCVDKGFVSPSYVRASSGQIVTSAYVVYGKEDLPYSSNAQLIAAAPTLLALAKQQREEIERLQKALADQTFNLAYAAEKRLAEAVAAEREACAKICDEDDGELSYYGWYGNIVIAQETLQRAAAAIRARGSQSTNQANFVEPKKDE